MTDLPGCLAVMECCASCGEAQRVAPAAAAPAAVWMSGGGELCAD